uniref:uncharacterized protein LOC122596875 n=1 Tax=Erigeron canadensis TaxID=72917 RepID=UPI001CB8ED23|nr:uncharacterized protein LOC122596875 [Erigeron canadensis]
MTLSTTNLIKSRTMIKRGQLYLDNDYVWHNINSVNSVARDLDSVGIVPLQSLSEKTGNGNGTCFWLNEWNGNVSLASKFPRLFNLELSKNAFNSDRWKDNALVSNWRRQIRGGAESSELNHLTSLLSLVVLVDESNKWKFSNSSMKEFSVKGMHHMIDEVLLTNSQVATRWNKLVPRKVNILGWRVLLNRIPTRSNLVNKSVEFCPICDNTVETSDHLFGNCEIALKVWSLVAK